MILNEITRKNLVGKSKSQSPDRFNRRLGYSPKSYKGIDISRLFNEDILIIEVPVGDYVCTIAFKGMLQHLKDIVDKQPKPTVTLQTVIKAMNVAIDNTDLLVDCTCPDFVYRFAYWATKYGYKFGKPEKRPSKITNPDDELGAMCKHLNALLSNKKWITKMASTLNQFIKENIDKIREFLGVSEDDFTAAKPSRIPKGSKFNKSTGKYELPDKNDTAKDQDEINSDNSDDDKDLELRDTKLKSKEDDSETDEEELELNDEESEE